MEFREGINLEKKTTAKDDGFLSRILDKLPLIIQGVDINKNHLSNRDNPASLIFSKVTDRFNTFSLQPKKGFGIICYLDSYLVTQGKYELPKIAMKPGWQGDRRPVMEVGGSINHDNYILEIYPLSNED